MKEENVAKISTFSTKTPDFLTLNFLTLIFLKLNFFTLTFLTLIFLTHFYNNCLTLKILCGKF